MAGNCTCNFKVNTLAPAVQNIAHFHLMRDDNGCFIRYFDITQCKEQDRIQDFDINLLEYEPVGEVSFADCEDLDPDPNPPVPAPTLFYEGFDFNFTSSITQAFSGVADNVSFSNLTDTVLQVSLSTLVAQTGNLVHYIPPFGNHNVEIDSGITGVNIVTDNVGNTHVIVNALGE